MKNMTIALVKISCMNDRLIPLGLACLQAYLKKNNIEVKVFNFRTSEYTLPKVASDPLIQLKPPVFIMNHQDFPLLIPIVDSIRNNREVNLNQGIFYEIIRDYSERLGESALETLERFESIIKYIRRIIPEIISPYSIIGFSVNYLSIPETVIASAIIKKLNPDIQIIWGGPSITQSQKAFKIFLRKRVCDGLVIGEGEAPLLEIARKLDLKSIKGVMSINDKDNFHYVPGIQLDLDSLPTPDYTDIPLDTYFQIASVYRSRGCSHRCKFCAEWKLFGPRFRVRSIENIIKDIEIIIDKHNPQYMIFGESLVNDDLSYFEQLCDAMQEKHFDMKFGTHFRANITPKLARKAYLAGFNDAWVGFEAFSDEDLKQMNKGTNVHQNITTIKNLTKAGVNVIAMLVVGFSNLQEEEKNCENILKIIDYFSNERCKVEEGKERLLSIQWRPAPMYLVPGSFDYKEKVSSHTWSWKSKFINSADEKTIKLLESELSCIPYEFKRPIPDEMVGSFMRKIQIADRNSKFAIGGLAKHIINYLVISRKRTRNRKRIERVGIIAQRFNKEILQT